MRRYFTFARLALIVGAVILLSGCSAWRKTVEVPVYIHDTVRTTKEVHDSTYIDRWRTQWMKGDTVFIHDSIDRWRNRYVHDTVFKYKEKPVKTTETKEVAKPLSWLQKTEIIGFWGLLAAGVLFFVVWRLLRRLGVRSERKELVEED